MTSNKENKNLKSKVDGDQLDLSFNDLSVVPVREIAALKKVTALDLSSNHIVTLPDEFCNLKNLVQLDLSSNGLISLPEQFGKLENLQHLDLYKNRLETLPPSFSHLKQLRWLDVKDNPLEDNLRKVAGDCIDPKQCKEAATKVVRYMQQVTADKERQRQKELKKQREVETAEKVKEDEGKQAKATEKKKEKERKKEMKSLREEEYQKKQKFTDETKAPQKERGAARSVKPSKKHKGRGLTGYICCLASLIFSLVLFAILASLLLTIGLYANCSQPAGHEFIPKSRQLCQDVYQMVQTGQITTPTWDYEASFHETRSSLQRYSNIAVESVKQFDYIGWKDTIIDLSLTCRDTIVQFCIWTYENGSEVAKPLLKQLIEWFWIGVDFAWWALQQAVQYAVRFGKWAMELIMDVINNYPAYWEKVKYYWKNLK